MSLNYKLIKSSDELLQTGRTSPAYSILCISYDVDGGCDCDFIYDFTSEEQNAIYIFQLIIDGTVTPTTLRELITDLI